MSTWISPLGRRIRAASLGAGSRGLKLALISVLLAAPVGAQPVPVGADFQANTYTTGAQRGPSVSMNDAGAFVAVWTSAGSSGTDRDDTSILGQRFAPDGTPVGTEFQVNTYTTIHAYQAAIAAAETGAFLVTWNGGRSDGSGRSIQARYFGADGEASGDQFQVNSYTTGKQSYPSVAAGPGTGFVVVWQTEASSDLDPPHSEIRGRRFDADGSAIGPDFAVNAFTTANQRVPSVAASAGNGFVVVWDSDLARGTDTDGYSVHGQRFRANATALGTEFQINTYTTGVQDSPAVAIDDDGVFAVVWTNAVPRATNPRGADIAAQRFAADGSVAGTEFRVNSYTTDGQDTASIAVAPRGGFVVAWRSFGSTGSDDSYISVQAQRITAEGRRVGGELQVNSYTTDAQRSPSVAAAQPDEFVVVWTGYGSTGTDTRVGSIQGRRLRDTDPPQVCGDPVDPTPPGAGQGSAGVLAVSDSLAILQASVGIFTCAPCVCDVDSSGTVAPSDALIVLREVVGIPVRLACPACT